MRVAFDAVRDGHHVIPLWPRNKTPKDKEWEPAATRDPGRIRDIWRSLPYNGGIACRPSGLYVLDLDDAHGHEPPPEWAGATHGRNVLAHVADAAGQPHPAHTFTVRTPSLINGRSSRLGTVVDEGRRWAIRLVGSVLSGGVDQRAETAAPRPDRVPW
ncbi:bifunctional DNA primase/polymerase [Saccharothrix isguenensis]